MFETAVVHARGRSREQRAGLFTVSIAAHTVVAAALVFAGIQSLQFPTNAPNQMGRWIPVAAPPVPPALGTPRPAHPSPQPPAAPRAAAPQTVSAPQTIPDQIQPASSSTVAADPNASNVGDGPIGETTGVEGGINTETPVAKPEPPPARVYTQAEVSNPPVVIRRVAPEYPAIAQRMRLSGWVVVEGIIDKSGRIHEPKVVASSFNAFEKPALDAVQQWEFRPGILRGESVDTLFQLKVTFTLH